jgi:hypothetical protein
MPPGDRLAVFYGQHWLRKKDQKPFHVRQVWRKDRTAQLEDLDGGESLVVHFRALAREYRQLKTGAIG